MRFRCSEKLIVFISFLFLSEKRLSCSALVPRKNPASVMMLSLVIQPQDFQEKVRKSEKRGLEKRIVSGKIFVYVKRCRMHNKKAMIAASADNRHEQQHSWCRERKTKPSLEPNLSSVISTSNSRKAVSVTFHYEFCSYMLSVFVYYQPDMTLLSLINLF